MQQALMPKADTGLDAGTILFKKTKLLTIAA